MFTAPKAWKILFCLLAALCGVASGAKEGAAAAPTIEVSGAEHLKGLKRVAITQFMIDIITEQGGKASSSSSWGLTRTKQKTELMQVDPAQMQALANAYYDQVVADLTAAGVEVVGREQLEANADYQALKAKGFPSPFVQEPANRDGITVKGTFVAAHGTPIYFLKDRSEEGGGKNSYVEIGTLMSIGFKVSYVESYERGIAKAFDAHLLRVRMTLPFAELTTSGGLFRSSSSVETRSGLRLDAMASRYDLVAGGSKKARIGIKEDFFLQEPFGKLEKVKGENYFFAVDGKAYVEVVGRHLAAAHRAFQAEILARR